MNSNRVCQLSNQYTKFPIDIPWNSSNPIAKDLTDSSFFKNKKKIEIRFLLQRDEDSLVASSDWNGPITITPSLTVTIELPEQEETIGRAYDKMRGTYKGEIPDGYKLWVLAQDAHNYFLMYPPPSINTSTKSWSQRSVLTSPGRWEIHVCLANRAASQLLENKAKSGDFSGFPSLPDGMEIVKSVSVVVQ
jgi:hypothetical protein